MTKIYPLKLTVRVTEKEKAGLESKAKKAKAESVSRYLVIKGLEK